MASRIKLGIVGGNNDAFIGGVHRIASRIDDLFDFAAAAAIRAKQSRQAMSKDVVFPAVHHGLKGVQSVDACVRSSQRKGAWVHV